MSSLMVRENSSPSGHRFFGRPVRKEPYVSSIGLLIVSLVMLKGVFSKVTACAGIVASVEGIVGGFYMVVPALALLLVPCLIAFGIWSVLAGSTLYKLSARPAGV